MDDDQLSYSRMDEAPQQAPPQAFRSTPWDVRLDVNAPEVPGAFHQQQPPPTATDAAFSSSASALAASKTDRAPLLTPVAEGAHESSASSSLGRPGKQDPRVVMLLLLYLGGIAAYMVGLAADQSWLTLCSKPLPLMALIMWTGNSRPRAHGTSFNLTRSPHAALFACLCFGLLGDMLLETGYFIPGLICFLIGHLLYATAFTMAAGNVAPLQIIPLLLFGAMVCGLMIPHLGDMLAPVACYMVVSLVMAWRAAAWAEARGRWAWLAAIGAVIFMLSDSIIAINRFVNDLEGGGAAIIMLTYWAAQALMTASLVLEY